MIKEQTQTQSQAVVEETASKLPAMVALIFGAFIVLGAGFAQSNTIHDAAHDVRHAFSLPCH
jgi:cobalt transporter subunit CbtB